MCSAFWLPNGHSPPHCHGNLGGQHNNTEHAPNVHTHIHMHSLAGRQRAQQAHTLLNALAVQLCDRFQRCLASNATCTVYFLLICHDNVKWAKKIAGENSMCVAGVGWGEWGSVQVTSQTSTASSANAVKTQLDLDSSREQRQRQRGSKVAQLKRSVAKIPVRCVEKPRE